MRLWRASKSHRIEQRSIPKTSRATVRRAMTQRATCPVPLVTLTRGPLSHVKVVRLCRRCDTGLTVAVTQPTFNSRLSSKSTSGFLANLFSMTGEKWLFQYSKLLQMASYRLIYMCDENSVKALQTTWNILAENEETMWWYFTSCWWIQSCWLNCREPSNSLVSCFWSTCWYKSFTLFTITTYNVNTIVGWASGRASPILAALLHSTWTVGVKLCGVQQRAPPIFGTAAITSGVLLLHQHFCYVWLCFYIVLYCVFVCTCVLCNWEIKLS